ncbi:hypothetical protein HPP92_009318 [Vanilla planifolia]|uniref:Formin-like protein n=1 Tax=Vanilla planifolia TaxID=51239 RepID=A0A835V7A8_VANPL|nr:hypothetical protein HPP92_009318 [Vanilla planifolia]
MAPTKEEELKLRDYTGEASNLGSSERFLKAVLDVPFAFRRVDAMLYRANFEAEIKYLRTSYETLEAACEDLRNSRLFLKLLEAVLRTGNRINVGTNRGEARAFKLDALPKLAEVKGTDGKTTLLDFVVREIVRSEGGLGVISGMGCELGNVKKAAAMDSDVLAGYLSKLEQGLEKLRSVVRLRDSCEDGGGFFDGMEEFLREAEREIARVRSDERRALRRVAEITEYFHGDVAREEAHPLRIFVVVRDFLQVLDHVCKDGERIRERAVMGSAKCHRIPASSPQPPP